MTKFTIINNVKNIVRESHLKNYAIAEKCGYSPKNLVTCCVAEKE